MNNNAEFGIYYENYNLFDKFIILLIFYYTKKNAGVKRGFKPYFIVVYLHKLFIIFIPDSVHRNHLILSSYFS